MTNNRMYFIANWKMFGSVKSVNSLNKVISYSKTKKLKANIIYCPPYTLINIFINKLKKSKFKFNDLTKNEISNDHLRHMVGGRNNQDADKDSERIFRSEFPQKPDALINFLS